MVAVHQVSPSREGATETPGSAGGGAAAFELALTLFVAGRTPSSQRARRQVQTWLDRRGHDGVSFQVIDVHDRPDLAELERILATPALLRHRPLPRRKLVGDLADWEAVVRDLDLAEGNDG